MAFTEEPMRHLAEEIARDNLYGLEQIAAKCQLYLVLAIRQDGGKKSILPLEYACELGAYKCASYLGRHTTRDRLPEICYHAPLIRAARGGHRAIVKELLDAEHYTMTDIDGAFWAALANYDRDMVLFLMKDDRVVLISNNTKAPDVAKQAEEILDMCKAYDPDLANLVLAYFNNPPKERIRLNATPDEPPVMTEDDIEYEEPDFSGGYDDDDENIVDLTAYLDHAMNMPGDRQ